MFCGQVKKRLCLVVADIADRTAVSAVSATTRHDRRVPNHFPYFNTVAHLIRVSNIPNFPSIFQSVPLLAANLRSQCRYDDTKVLP